MIKYVIKNSDSVDDFLAANTTDADGFYYLEGSEDERVKIEPYLRIHHDCNKAGKRVEKRVVLKNFNPSIEVARAESNQEDVFLTFNSTKA